MDKLRLINKKTLGLELEAPICTKCGKPVPVTNAKVNGKNMDHRVCHA